MCGTAAALPRPRIMSNRSRSNTRQRIVTHMECSWHMRLLCLRSGGLETILRATECPRQEVRRRVNRLPRPFGGAARHRDAANKPTSPGNQHKQPLAAQANHTSARIDAAQAIMNVSSAQAITYRTTVSPSTPDGLVWWHWIRDGSRRRCAGGRVDTPTPDATELQRRNVWYNAPCHSGMHMLQYPSHHILLHRTVAKRHAGNPVSPRPHG